MGSKVTNRATLSELYIFTYFKKTNHEHLLNFPFRDDIEEVVLTEVECGGDTWTGHVSLPTSCSSKVSLSEI